MKLTINKTVQLHLIYWIGFVLFFTIIWGTYDHDYLRNFMVQLWSLPARLVLVYGTLWYLFPKLLLKEKYMQFTLAFIVLLLFTGITMQRSIMFFIVQGNFLPYRSESFFKSTEVMNTILDVNLALVIPVAYTFYKNWYRSKQRNEKLVQQNEALIANQKEKFITLKEGNTRHKVFLKDIIFIESLKNYIKVKTDKGEIVAYKSISAIEEMLPEEDFLRVHRSFIVSMRHISSFSPTQINLNETQIPVGRKYKHEVKQRLDY